MIRRLLQGKATRKEKISLFIKAIGSLFFTTGGLLLLFFSVLLLLIFGSSSSNHHITGGGEQFPEAVLQWKEKVQEECEKNEIPEAVNYILGIITVETGGNAVQYPDIMQCSESQGWAPNTISDPYQSIEIGVKYFADAYKSYSGHDLLNVIQGYNFGMGFLDYSGETYDFQKAVSFSQEKAGGQKVTYTNPVAASLGYTYRYKFGNMFYAKIVEQYLTSGSEGGQGNGEFKLPVGENYTITSPFGGRVHPITGVYSFHKGIDLITNETDAPIYATADGTVVYSGVANGYGNYIVIQHDDTTFSGYGHNKTNQVKVGDTVKTGQQIAIMGTTGESTGVHLHFEIMKNTTDFWSGYVDPAPLLGIG